MSKSVLDLQNDCLNNSIPCSQLLLKAYTIARKLNIEEMVYFCRNEMDGYQNNSDDVPDYREVCIDLQLSNGHRWSSVTVSNNSYLSKHSICQSTKELEILCLEKRGIFQIKLTTEQLDIMRKACNNSHIYEGAKIISTYQLEGIIFKIRRIILEWAIKLGEDDVWGENLEFTSEEQEKAKNVPSIQIIINGNVSNSNLAGILKDSISNIQMQDKSK